MSQGASIMNWTDQVSAISSLVSAVTSCFALVGVILAIKTYKADVQERKDKDLKSSVAVVEESAQIIGQSVKRKIELERSIEPGFDPFSYEHISNNYKIESEVFSILNEYESLCYRTLNNLLVKEVWFQVRGDAFKKTIEQYTPYINRYIENTESPDAWLSCRTLYQQNF